MVQLPNTPDLGAQRAAMKKLEFLVGKWTGEAQLQRDASQTLFLGQTEDVQYKLDGLILLIEGIGRSKSDEMPLLQALAVISYDDGSRTYRMRAFNDGRFLESQVALLEQGNGMTWGFALADVRTNSTLRMNEKGEWTEIHEITVGSQPARTLMQIAVRRQL